MKQGWVAHEEAWEAFVTSVADNPSAPIPWPKPNLLTKYLASAAADLSDVATQTYRDLIRKFHPDRFNRTIGMHLLEKDRDAAAARALELTKQINDAFGK